MKRSRRPILERTDIELTADAGTPRRTANPITGAREISAKEREIRNARYQKQKDQLRRTKDLGAGLKKDKATRTAAAKRKYLNALRVANCMKVIAPHMPQPGEALHCVFKGNNDGFDILPAIIEIAGGTVGAVAIATLGFNRRNFEALTELITAGTIEPEVLFVCSVLHEARDPELCNEMAEMIRGNGGSFVAVRSHCKVITVEAGDNFYSIESSANLRSCRMAEQFVVSNDPELLQFHRHWMTEIGAS